MDEENKLENRNNKEYKCKEKKNRNKIDNNFHDIFYDGAHMYHVSCLCFMSYHFKWFISILKIL